jgi:hypothetical protein
LDETFGQRKVRGRETRAQLREQRGE